MCVNADLHQEGLVTWDAFVGILCYMTGRPSPHLLAQLRDLFFDPATPGYMNYGTFFWLMEPEMPQLRREKVKRAYRKLRRSAKDGVVNISEVMLHWRPQCYVEVVRDEWPEYQAKEDFFCEWKIEAADGTVQAAEFMRYYRDVSMTYASDTAGDADFVNMMERSWGV